MQPAPSEEITSADLARAGRPGVDRAPLYALFEALPFNEIRAVSLDLDISAIRSAAYRYAKDHPLCRVRVHQTKDGRVAVQKIER